VSVVSPETLQPVDRAEAATIIAIAARVGSTRLIDNHVVGQAFPA
jgi:pantothenate synthetase